MTPDARALIPARARSPFYAALALSALVHWVAPQFLSGGGARPPSVFDVGRTLSVRIVAEPKSPTIDPLPKERAPSPDPRDPAPNSSARVKPTSSPPKTTAAPQPAPAGASGALPEGPDLTFYPAKQLDVYPTLSTDLDLAALGKAAGAAASGRAQLLVLIDEVGIVRDVSVVEAHPAHYVEDDAKRVFMAARFTPAYRNGRAVRSRVLIEVNYGAERGSP